MFWSCDGIQMLIGKLEPLFFPRNLSKTVMALLTASLVMVILYISPVLFVSTACLLEV